MSERHEFRQVGDVHAYCSVCGPTIPWSVAHPPAPPLPKESQDAENTEQLIARLIDNVSCATQLDHEKGELPHVEEWIANVRPLLVRVRSERVVPESQDAEVTEESETAWLIESRFTPGPSWWMGTGHPAPWTRDSLQAVRFMRKQDAEAAMATLPDAYMCFVSEHQWGFGPTALARARSDGERQGREKGIEEAASLADFSSWDEGSAIATLIRDRLLAPPASEEGKK